MHSEDYSQIQEALEKAFSGEQSAQLCRYRTSAGGYVDMLQSFKPVKDESNGAIKSVKSVVKLELKES